jgi:hypothetical protein
VRQDTILFVPTGLEAGLVEAHRAWVRLPGGRRCACHAHVFDIIAVFREPRSLQDGLDRLTPRASSALSLVAIMSTIASLHLDGFLVTPGEPAATRGVSTGFSAAPEHISMLNDRSRTNAFLRAIRATVKPGDVAVDLGTGTGVLAIAAAQAGAARVYALEAGAMADRAAAMFERSGFGDRIVLLRRWSTDAVLDERADVLVTETLGNDPASEGLFHLVADARRRFLKPDARVIPSRIRSLAQPVTTPTDRQDRLRFSDRVARRWTGWYGIDFGPLADASPAQTGMPYLAQADVAGWPRLCDPISLADADVARGASFPACGHGRGLATQDGVVDGVLLCWEATLGEATHVSTAPGAPGMCPSWRVRLVLLPRSLTVRCGDAIVVTLEQRAPPRVTCVIERRSRAAGRRH